MQRNSSLIMYVTKKTYIVYFVDTKRFSLYKNTQKKLNIKRMNKIMRKKFNTIICLLHVHSKQLF